MFNLLHGFAKFWTEWSWNTPNNFSLLGYTAYCMYERGTKNCILDWACLVWGENETTLSISFSILGSSLFWTCGSQSKNGRYLNCVCNYFATHMSSIYDKCNFNINYLLFYILTTNHKFIEFYFVKFKEGKVVLSSYYTLQNFISWLTSFIHDRLPIWSQISLLLIKSLLFRAI